MKNRIIKKIINLIPIIFFLGLIAALSYSIYYSCKLEEQIWERDKTIQELSFRSKLVENYFDINYNPADSTTSYVLKESKRNLIIPTEREHTISRDSLIQNFNLLIHENNELINDFNSLIVKLNSLEKESVQSKNEIKRLKTVLKMIENKYNISYEVSIDSSTTTTRLRNTDMVDSGLVLLPYYRDKIERKANGLWIITH